MVRGRTAVAGALLLACAACTATTSGHGSTGPAGSGVPSAAGPSGTVPSGTVPSGTVPSGVPTAGGTPSAVPAPAACPGGTCRQAMSTTLGAPYAVVVRSNPAYANGTGATIVELTAAGVPVGWTVLPSESPSEITCSSTPSQSNCVLVDHVGAHRSDAIVFRLAGGALRRGGTVAAATPEMHARDLNGDGWVDAAGLQNTGVPDYATGKVYWQTWASDGTGLRSTGCTGLAASAPPVPTTLLHGSCP